MFISRLITELGVTLDNRSIIIQCDNVQTIRLINADMIADGLTKALPAQQFQKFVMQVGLVDINDKIQERRFKELTAEDFVRAEEQLDGGRAE
ncbi:hypothetical protein HZ326_24988 [Fusarium oxysporum f. sp. albedinis]|nr:hypothetical protein HZ326_24988 [Fusarium oxysporum f. sp. albedinis]